LTRWLREAFAASLVAGVLLFGCGGSADKKYNETCGSSSDCTSGLTCPTTGPMSGKCTKSCTKDEECASIGTGVCTSDVCAPK
jgi:hypothetical protein